MINTLRIFEELQQVMEPPAARKITEIIGSVFEELRNTVTKAEFNELKEIVRDLVEAQKRTEQRVEELAVAQKRTEQRVGEGKSQLSQSAVDAFLRKKLTRFTGLYDEIFPILVTHMITSPKVEEYVKKKGIALYYTYDF